MLWGNIILLLVVNALNQLAIRCNNSEQTVIPKNIEQCLQVHGYSAPNQLRTTKINN